MVEWIVRRAQGDRARVGTLTGVVCMLANVASMRLRIHAMAQQIDSRLSIPDLRCVPGPTHTNVIFDCVRPSDLGMGSDELKHALAQRVESEFPKSIAKITIDDDYVGHTHE